jgi:DNA repair protein RecO (recombination protein O)
VSKGALQVATGYVLHRRPWRESSVLVDMITPELGRIGLVARSARSERSPWRGLVEPFMPLSVRFVQAGEMGTVRELEAIGDRIALQGRALWCGLYLNELLLSLLDRHEPLPDVYSAYCACLFRIATQSEQAPSLRLFEWQLLDALGVAPSLTVEADGETPIQAERQYRLDPEAGFYSVGMADSGAVQGEVIAWLTNPTPGLSDSFAKQALSITRRLIDHQLGGKTLKTREMMRALL